MLKEALRLAHQPRERTRHGGAHAGNAHVGRNAAPVELHQGCNTGPERQRPGQHGRRRKALSCQRHLDAQLRRQFVAIDSSGPHLDEAQAPIVELDRCASADAHLQ
jgi:hypothetical protein